jgi:MFS family permease
MKANSADAAQNLTGDQYSTIGSAGYWAQLAWQPFSAYLIVKVPPRILMPVSPTTNLRTRLTIPQCLVGFWGISMIGMAFSTSFGPLLANRFLLGLFEAGCLPLFTVIATSYYRKIECTWAIAMFYSQNGIGMYELSPIGCR